MTRITIAKRLATAVVACALAFAQPVAASAAAGAHFGSGGFHGGGRVAGGFHGGGGAAGGFHSGGFHGFAAGHTYYGGEHWYNGPHGWWGGGFGVGLATPYLYGEGWYCGDPPGYYPSVTQCYSGWETVPAY
jgi:hypothetical protein